MADDATADQTASSAARGGEPEAKAESPTASSRREPGPGEADGEAARDPDAGTSTAVPDRAVPGQAVPDQAVPDQAVPDQGVPDPDSAGKGAAGDSDGGAAGSTGAAGTVDIAGTRGTAKATDLPDPLHDLEQRRYEAGVDEAFPFGRPGQPLGRFHPFMFGLVGALGVFTAWLLIQAFVNVRQVLVLIVVSMFLAIGLNPAVERLKRFGIRRGLAVAMVFVGVLLFFVGFGFAIVPPLTEQVTKFATDLPGYVEQLQNNPRINELLVRYDVQNRVNEALANPQFGQQFGQRVFGGIIGVGKVVLSGVFSLVTVLILTLYFLGSFPSIKTFAYRLAPRTRRARVALLSDEILDRIGGYVAGIITVAFTAGIASYIFLLIVGVPYALPLAMIVAFTAFIPLVGATIGAVVVTIVAFFHGPATGIACIIFFVAYQQFENFIVHPRVMKRAVDVQPAVTIIAALIGGALLGIVGALLAIPTAAAIALILREVVMPRQETL